MVIKKKPEKPYKRQVTQRETFYSHTSLSNILDLVERKKLDPKDVTVCTVGGYDGDHEIELSWENKEVSERQYAADLAKYEKDLKEWDEWYKENKVFIEEYEALLYKWAADLKIKNSPKYVIHDDQLADLAPPKPSRKK